MKSYKIIDDKISQWRNKADKQAYLAQFSSTKWSKTTQLRQNLHSLRNCKCCKSFHASLSEKFPESKQNKNKPKGPFTDINIRSAKHVPKKAQPTKGELKAVGEMIFSTYDKTCKENLGKSLSEVLLAVPQLNIQEKQSANERKQQRLKKQREFKTYVEAVWKENDVDSHLAQRTSLAAREKQRIHQSFETIQQAKSRVEKTPPGMKERSHIPTEVTGNTEQLLEDVRSWPHEPVCWSAKAREYQIRGNTNDTTPPNGGQIIKEFLKSNGVDITPFESVSGGENKQINEYYIHDCIQV